MIHHTSLDDLRRNATTPEMQMMMTAIDAVAVFVADDRKRILATLVGAISTLCAASSRGDDMLKLAIAALQRTLVEIGGD